MIDLTPRNRSWINTAVAASLSTLAMALPAQAQKAKLETLGLPDITAMPPEWSPQPYRPGTGAQYYTSQPGYITPDILRPTPSSRSLSDPKVNGKSVGLFNTSSQSLSFYLTVGTERRQITLEPNEIVTVTIPENVELKGVVGTGSSDHTTTLSRGEIYLLRAQSGSWVFSRL